VNFLEEPFISVVIPAFNEEQNIGFVLTNVHKILKETSLPYEIIVVNDGSTDRTAEIVKEHNAFLVNHGRNSGKGNALKTGFVMAKGKIVVMMDADGSHRPEDIPLLIDPLLNGSEVDVVIGSRFNDEVSRNSTTRLHLIGNKLINTVIFFLTGKYVSDSQTGFRAFRREVLKRLALWSTKFEIESELTVKMLKDGVRVREVPIRCMKRLRGNSKVSSFRDGFEIFKAILKATFCK